MINSKLKENAADIIFVGGDIITVDDANPTAEALAVKDGKIIEVGKHDEVLQWKGTETQLIDLKGKTLMPGLIEPHTHPAASAFFYNMIDASGINNPNGEAVMEKLRNAAANKKPGEWIAAFGYDPILMRDLGALNADMLDEISTVHPIFVMIQSMHTVFVNHKALEVVGVTNETPDPEGAHYVKDEDGNLTGVIVEQNAIAPFMYDIVSKMGGAYLNLIEEQFSRYAQAGITTIFAPGFFPIFPNTKNLVKELVERDNSPIRLVYMNAANDLERGTSDMGEEGPGTDRYRCVGVKFWYDGSPYTGNMFLEEPYLNSKLMQEGLGVPKDTCGERLYTKERFGELVKKYHDAGWQISVHTQGDRSTQEVFDAYEEVLMASPRDDHRHRIEHCALFPEEQIERAARLGVTPSFHINHNYYYGEALRDEIVGAERANKFMPVGTALKYGHRISLHADSPMYPALPLTLLRTAVTRKTRNDAVLGASEAITIDDAIKAVTINAAWQSFMEDKVGSLEVGKYADLVVLAENPRKIDPDRLDKIQIIETYLEGRRVTRETIAE